MATLGIFQRQLPISATADSIVGMQLSDAEIYKALFDLSQSIAGHTDLETLCNSLAATLGRVISFDFLGLILHDAVHNTLRVHAVSTNMPYHDKEIVVPVDSDHFGAWVWREQKPLVLSPLSRARPLRQEMRSHTAETSRCRRLPRPGCCREPGPGPCLRKARNHSPKSGT